MGKKGMRLEVENQSSSAVYSTHRWSSSPSSNTIFTRGSIKLHVIVYIFSALCAIKSTLGQNQNIRNSTDDVALTTSINVYPETDHFSNATQTFTDSSTISTNETSTISSSTFNSERNRTTVNTNTWNISLNFTDNDVKTTAINSTIDKTHDGSTAGIVLAVLLFLALFTALVVYIWYSRKRRREPIGEKTTRPESSASNDTECTVDSISSFGRYPNGNHISYINRNIEIPKENSDEMMSLDNDSFLNSLEAMTIPNYWADNIKNTKV